MQKSEQPNFRFYGKQAIIFTRGKITKDAQELAEGGLFSHTLSSFISELRSKDSPLLSIFPPTLPEEKQDEQILLAMQLLAVYPREEVIRRNPELAPFFSDIHSLHQFVEGWYNYWRGFERTLICYSDSGARNPLHAHPYTTFQGTIESLNHAIRKLYRDICENIIHEHPKIFRQVPAGAQVGLIISKGQWKGLPAPYEKLREISFIRQVLIEPPLLIDPPNNKRTGGYKMVDSNPLESAEISHKDWLCYPAIVGDKLIHIYFHNHFISLGTALANLFELAGEAEIGRKPDAIFTYGLPEGAFEKYGHRNVVFEDEKNGLLVGAVPCTDDFGYFGYLKKMALTLHNLLAMKGGRLPVHGAMVSILLRNGRSANVVLVGDTGAGKSESLEAFRTMGREKIRSMEVIFDDMGSLAIEGNKILAYGTEVGAFVRLDDLQPGFAFGNIDRSIIMSPQKRNARVVLPITTLALVQRGTQVDYLVYANNYEQADSSHPYFELFKSPQEAIGVFRQGRSMAKGTTTDTGLTQSYFANIFGPPLKKELHERIAEEYFAAMSQCGVKLGQLRTQLGIPGMESKGPEDAALAMLEELGR